MELRIDKRRSTVSLKPHNVICIEQPPEDTVRIGVHAVTRIVIFGQVHLDTDVLRCCATHGVPILFLPTRGRSKPLSLLPPTELMHSRRVAQYEHFLDPSKRARLAKLIVTEKLAHQNTWLRQFGCHEPFRQFDEALSDESIGLATLRGMEGAAAAKYFRIWGAELPEPWAFTTRTRRPPTDPVNALLSLTYTLAIQPIATLAVGHGLETNIGFLHDPAPNRPALCLDLLEPARAWIDEFVRSLLKSNLLTPEDFFIDQNGACFLTKEGRSKFFSHWTTTQVETLLIAPQQLAAKLVTELLSSTTLSIDDPS